MLHLSLADKFLRRLHIALNITLLILNIHVTYYKDSPIMASEVSHGWVTCQFKQPPANSPELKLFMNQENDWWIW